MAIQNVPVRLDTGDGWIDAVVKFGTDNRKTLMVEFDGVVDGAYGLMALSQEADGGPYVNRFNGNPIGLEWK